MKRTSFFIVLLVAALALLFASCAKKPETPAQADTTAATAEPAGTEPSETDAPTTAAPATDAPTAAAPATDAPTTAAPTADARSEAETLLAGFKWFGDGKNGPPQDATRLPDPDGAEGEWLFYAVPQAADSGSDRRLDRVSVQIGQYGMMVNMHSYKRISADGAVTDDPDGMEAEILGEWEDGAMTVFGSDEITFTGFYRSGGKRIAVGEMRDFNDERFWVAMIEA